MSQRKLACGFSATISFAVDFQALIFFDDGGEDIVKDVRELLVKHIGLLIRRVSLDIADVADDVVGVGRVDAFPDGFQVFEIGKVFIGALIEIFRVIDLAAEHAVNAVDNDVEVDIGKVFDIQIVCRFQVTEFRAHGKAEVFLIEAAFEVLHRGDVRRHIYLRVVISDDLIIAVDVIGDCDIVATARKRRRNDVFDCLHAVVRKNAVNVRIVHKNPPNDYYTNVRTICKGFSQNITRGHICNV